MKLYVIGFIASLVLTLAAYACVQYQLFSGVTLLVIVGVMALAQAMVQLYYFLHLGKERKPRVKLITLGFMLTILVTIVGGSLWIMHHLNYNMMQMSPSQMNEYMTSQKIKVFDETHT